MLQNHELLSTSLQDLAEICQKKLQIPDFRGKYLEDSIILAIFEEDNT